MLDTTTPFSPKDITQMAEVTKNVLPQTVAEIDGAISTIMGLFNSVVLYPIKKANITFRYKIECFEKDLRKEIQSIPIENLCEPKLMVTGPTLEALRYTYDEQELRKMYLKLIASSMNTKKTEIAHPSFVDIIRQMNSVDARTFQSLNKIGENGRNILAINPQISIVGTNSVYAMATPEWFVDLTVPDCNIFEVSASLIRLKRLGIIELMYDRTVKGNSYDQLKQAPVLVEILENYKKSFPENKLALSGAESALYINQFGQQFASCCL